MDTSERPTYYVWRHMRVQLGATPATRRSGWYLILTTSDRAQAHLWAATGRERGSLMALTTTPKPPPDPD